jgi:hypothetical protein
MDALSNRARNQFMLGVMAEDLGMAQEAASNYFEALFAAADSKIFELVKDRPNDHAERLTILEARVIRNKVREAFGHAGIPVPGDDEIRKKLEELSKRKTLV